MVSADGYVHTVEGGGQGGQGGVSMQYTSPAYSSGVQYNPGGGSRGLTAGGVNSGYSGSMDSINSNTLSYDSDLSAGNVLMMIDIPTTDFIFYVTFQEVSAQGP